MSNRSNRSKVYDPRHAAQRRIAAAIIAVVAVIVITAGIIYIVVTNPDWMPDHSKPSASPAAVVCRFYSKNVTVDLNGATSCTTLFRALADDTDTMWTSTTLTLGEQFAQMGKGPFTVRVYENGNKPFAGRISNWFVKMQWRPEPVTSPTPAPSP